jgi:pimeloyl-ACP methyl ester carboxylesterase
MAALVPGDVATNGINIHNYRTEKKPKHAWPTLVFLHGITDSGLCWPRVVRALEGEYDLVLPDARGHGQSDKPKTGYAPADHAADVAGLIRALELDRPALIGHSMGGGVASTTAALYPELVGAVILEDPAWLPHEDPETRARRMAEWHKRIVDERALAPEQLVAKRKSEMPLWADEEFPDWVQAKMQVTPDVTGFDPGMRRTPWQQTAVAIQCSALLIGADVTRGAIVGAAQAGVAQAINPNIQVAIISGAGHNIRREQFEAYMAVLRRFLAELERPAA